MKTLLTAITVMGAILLSRSVHAQAPEEINEGEDETRPLARFDLKYQYQNLPPSQNDNSQIITLRLDKPFVLAPDWQLATRFDVPISISDAVSADNPKGDTSAGLGDLLAQALLIQGLSTSRFAWAAGARLVFPTASEDQMGAGKWRIVSTAAARWFMPEVTKGSWATIIVRYDVDLAGNANRAHISELQLGPQFYLQLPGTWFLQSYPATDIRYNFAKKRRADTGRWFVPLDFVVGRMLNESTIASLEIGVPIVNEYKVYDFKIEGRIGYFF